MKNNLNLSIPTPCHQNWYNFEPTRRGAFCQSCNKEVIDFTSWSDSAIIEYFNTKKDTPTCGRFRKSQMKDYPHSPVRQTPKLLPISMLGAALAFTSPEAYASDVTKPPTELASYSSLHAPTDSSGRKTIQGIILSVEDKSPIPGVNITLKGSNVGAVSDGDGQFSIDIKNLKETDTLVFSFIGYATLEKRIADIGNTPVLLELDSMMLGGAVIMGGISAVRCTPRGIWWRIKNIFRLRS